MLAGSLQLHTYEAGCLIVKEGDADTSMFFLRSGVLHVLSGASLDAHGKVNGGTKLRQLLPGCCFGQRAVLYGEARSSTVVATTQCVVFSLSALMLKEVLGEDIGKSLEQEFMLSILRRSCTDAVGWNRPGHGGNALGFRSVLCPDHLGSTVLAQFLLNTFICRPVVCWLGLLSVLGRRCREESREEWHPAHLFAPCVSVGPCMSAGVPLPGHARATCVVG